MKLKYLIILILIVLVGCSNNGINNSNSTTDSEDIAIVEDESVKVGSDSKLTEEEVTAKYSKGSDLVAEVYSKSLYPALKEEVEIKFKANNKGENKVETEFDYTIEILKSDNIIYTYSNTSDEEIEAGEDITLKTLDYSFNTYGTYEVKLYLDILNKAKELDESNNEDSTKIYVKEKTVSNNDDDEDEEPDEGKNGECKDTDGGIKFDKLGTCTDDGSFKDGRSDFCAGDDRLGEMFCNQFGQCDIELTECDGICKDGKCI